MKKDSTATLDSLYHCFIKAKHHQNMRNSCCIALGTTARQEAKAQLLSHCTGTKPPHGTCAAPMQLQDSSPMATGRGEMGECSETEKQAGRDLEDAMHITSVNSKTSFSITFCYPRVTT